MARLSLKLALIATCATLSQAIRAPEGPTQQCHDDAGPPWSDDNDEYGRNGRYHDNTPATPILKPDGECADPLKEACAAKGVKAAYLEGPAQCGGAGWFCRIMPQEGWSNGGGVREYGDKNFEHCNVTNADEKDQGGHCHGSDQDGVYGWWVRDHWFRGYAGQLHCCCDWEATKGVVNRCDYRRHVDASEIEADQCRDANEGHGKGFEGNCEDHRTSHPFNDPMDSKPDQCWTVTHFADPASVTIKDPMPSPPPVVKPPPPPPVVVDGYSQLYEDEHCCRSSDAKLRTVRRIGDEEKCAAECNKVEGCSHFAWSGKWANSNGGICSLCSKCEDPTGAPGNGQYYSSWAKKARQPSPSSPSPPKALSPPPPSKSPPSPSSSPPPPSNDDDDDDDDDEPTELAAVRVRGTLPYQKRTEGVYLNTGRPYRGQPRFERRDYRGRRWSLYHRKRGMWVLDFNKVSQSWSGTKAYSEDQPGVSVVDVDWEDFPGMIVEKVSASELEALSPMADVAEALRTFANDTYTDVEDDDAMTAEDGALVTAEMPAKEREEAADGEPADAAKAMPSSDRSPSAPLVAACVLSGVVIGVALTGLMYFTFRRRAASKATAVAEMKVAAAIDKQPALPQP